MIFLLTFKCGSIKKILYVYVNRAYGNLTKVMVGVILIILISVIIDKFFVALEKFTIKKWGMSYEKK